MEVAVHGVTDVRVRVTVHDDFTVKTISFINRDGFKGTVRLFGPTTGELQFIHEDTIDARENALC